MVQWPFKRWSDWIKRSRRKKITWSLWVQVAWDFFRCNTKQHAFATPLNLILDFNRSHVSRIWSLSKRKWKNGASFRKVTKCDKCPSEVLEVCTCFFFGDVSVGFIKDYCTSSWICLYKMLRKCKKSSTTWRFNGGRIWYWGVHGS